MCDHLDHCYTGGLLLTSYTSTCGYKPTPLIKSPMKVISYFQNVEFYFARKHLIYLVVKKAFRLCYVARD
jgi:hypothetical protein